MIKIGILKETKTPIDNRVALSPNEIVALKEKYPEVEFYVQQSDIRAFTDEEYAKRGIPVVETLENCDVMFGIKEAHVDSLLPNKHYIFFGHIAKMQPYNRPLIKKMIELGITFTDYEYLVDDNNVRLCAFGWWAGVVGAYNTLRAYGLRTRKFELEKPSRTFTLDKLLSNIKEIMPLCNTSIVITGNGRVSQGAQYVMQQVGATELTPKDFLSRTHTDTLLYTVLKTGNLVRRKSDGSYEKSDFRKNGCEYESVFDQYAFSAEILLSCHYWGPDQPVYLSKELLQDERLAIKIVGHVTCDIEGSIQSTLRASTHDDPFYDYNPTTMREEVAFSNEHNISVMAVDTCPNALALDTSKYFGETLSEYVFPLILEGRFDDPILSRATILKNGHLTDKYSYLKEYAEV